jgi:hypothetical protein
MNTNSCGSGRHTVSNPRSLSVCSHARALVSPPHKITQESKYRDAIRFFQPLIARNANKLLGVTAIVLANLCVSYIMTSQVCCGHKLPPTGAAQLSSSTPSAAGCQRHTRQHGVLSAISLELSAMPHCNCVAVSLALTGLHATQQTSASPACVSSEQRAHGCAVLCHAVLCHAVLCHAVLCHPRRTRRLRS